MNGSHPNSSRSLWALSNINRAWLPLGSALTTGAMVRAHGKGLGRIHQHTGAESFGLTLRTIKGEALMCACEGGGIIHRHA
jgi:hypothetical protein